jgi:hypothetical protein
VSRLCAGILLGVAGFAACTPSLSGVIGKGVDAGACIAKDAVAGKSVAQIATDCGTDVAEVIASLIASADPAVQKAPAAREAHAARRALGLPDDGGVR